MRLPALSAVVLALAASAALAQTDVGTQRVVLRGVVVNGADGAPLPRVRIDARSDAAIVASALTDDRGEFVMPVAPASVSLKAAKGGFATLAFSLTPEQLRGFDVPLRITMTRGAVIAGRFLTSGGDVPTMPLVVRRVGAAGQPDPQAASEARFAVELAVARVAALMTSPDVTAPEFMIRVDDRGEFRIGGLAPGRYELEPLRPAALNAAGIRAETTVVDLQPGSETAGVQVIIGDMVRPALIDGARTLTGTAAIRGRVLTTAGQPIAGADITIGQGASRPSVSAFTDALGRYAVAGLRAGSYTITVNKNGYVRTQHGSSSFGLPPLPIVLGEGQQLDDVDLVMPRASVVSGAVVDEYGDPVQDASVQLLRVNRARPGAIAARPQGSAAERTDDRGYFRLAPVIPGTYVLMVSVPPETVAADSGPRMAYASTYYPGTSDFAAAAALDIRSEENLPGLAIVLQRVPVARLAGVVIDSQGRPFAGVVRLTPRPVGNIRLEARVVHPDADGAFAFSDLPSGQYILQALAVPGGGAGPEFATVPVTIADRAPDALLVRTSPGSTLSGRFLLKGAPGGQPLWGYSMSAVALEGVATPASSSTVSGAVANGTGFKLSPLAGSMRLRFSSPDENWFLDSIVIQGVDAVDVPFEFAVDGQYTDVEVIFSRTAATVAGAATDERAAPVRDYAAIVFPVDRSKWFDGSRWLKMARAAADGTFRIGGLPPGDYWIAAIAQLPGTQAGGEWQDPELLDLLSTRAVRATLGPSEVHAVALRVVEARR